MMRHMEWTIRAPSRTALLAMRLLLLLSALLTALSGGAVAARVPNAHAAVSRASEAATPAVVRVAALATVPDVGTIGRGVGQRSAWTPFAPIPAAWPRYAERRRE